MCIINNTKKYLNNKVMAYNVIICMYYKLVHFTNLTDCLLSKIGMFTKFQFILRINCI